MAKGAWVVEGEDSSVLTKSFLIREIKSSSRPYALLRHIHEHADTSKPKKVGHGDVEDTLVNIYLL